MLIGFCESYDMWYIDSQNIMYVPLVIKCHDCHVITHKNVLESWPIMMIEPLIYSIEVILIVFDYLGLP